jgi:hypothetical protein
MVGGSYIIRGSTAESLVFVGTAIGTLIASKIAVTAKRDRFDNIDGLRYTSVGHSNATGRSAVW